MTEETHRRGLIGRRDLLASVLMSVGLIASYSLLAVQGALFVLPRRLGIKTRRLFIGHARSMEIGDVHTFKDLEGGDVMVKRDADGFRAFSSVCPHLGCRVHWQTEKRRFFCPCHNGVFDADGAGISGPPGDAGQRLGDIGVEHDEESGALFLRVATGRSSRS